MYRVHRIGLFFQLRYHIKSKINREQPMIRSKIKHPGYMFLIILLLFFIPMGIAWILYKKHDGLGEGMTNNGHLITPSFSINAIKLFNNQGRLLDNRFPPDNRSLSRQQTTNGRWLMLYLYPAPCKKVCQEGLYNMRQIRTATGKNRNRIERALLTYQGKKISLQLKKKLATKYAGTQHLTTPKRSFQKLFQKKVQTPYATSPGTLYLVDPHGNIMMIYKTGANPTGIYKDIKRLLRASQIG